VKAALLTLALLLAGHVPAARAQIAIPKFEALVVDLTGTLTAAQQSSLDEKLTAFQARKGSQVAVLILPSTQPEDIAQFGIRVAEAWKPGRQKVDDGAIFIVAKDDRAMRVEVGRGLEGVLTDITTSRILNDTVVPLLKQGDFFGGINAGVDQILRVVDGEPLPEPDRAWQPSGEGDAPLPFLLIAGFVALNFLRNFVGRAPLALIAGLGGGVVTWWLTSRIPLSAGVGFGLFFLMLVIGGRGGFGGGRGGGRVFRDIGRGGFGGWGGGFGGGRGGGFGGGGGGTFGGGGASARW
jgi:uncharacterized protein